jgi:hypothetical protein
MNTPEWYIAPAIIGCVAAVAVIVLIAVGAW